MSVIASIYKVINKLNDDMYIGSTVQKLERRWSRHKSDARTLKGKHNLLYDAIREYGEANFEISLIFEGEFENEDEVLRCEGYWQIGLEANLNARVAGRTRQETEKAYYKKNGQAKNAKNRERVNCPTCGEEMSRHCVRRHIKRKHS